MSEVELPQEFGGKNADLEAGEAQQPAAQANPLARSYIRSTVNFRDANRQRMQQAAAAELDREQGRQFAMSKLRASYCHLIVYSVLVIVMGIRYIPMLETVKECSPKLMWAGMIFYGYIPYNLVQSVLALSMNFVLDRPEKFWNGYSLFSLAVSLLYIPAASIFGLIAILSKDSLDCRTEETKLDDYWKFVMWFTMLYLFIFAILLCAIGVIVFFVCVALRQRGEGDAQNNPVFGLAQRLPGAEAAMEKIGHKKFGDVSGKGKDAEMCIICQENFSEDAMVSELNCDERHIFHEACLKPWLEQKLECPLCKKPVTAIE